VQFYLKNYNYSDSLAPYFGFLHFFPNVHKLLNILIFKSTQFHVPRGDHLSTLLFNIFIKDLPNTIINSEFFLFADDAKLIKIVRTQPDAINLQSDIDNLQIWCDMISLIFKY